MLCVRTDGGEIETTPALLAELVFEGKLDRHSHVRPADGVPDQPLELSLGWPECEALTAELHRRLQRMGTLDSSATDLEELCALVERLCQWRWTNAPRAARFFWTAGWLNELAGRPKRALDYYDTFLLMPAGESHLRLAALNNRGVLRIGSGRRDGIRDLAQAAFGGVPAACFNLLNLINTSFGAADLLEAVDQELGAFFAQLPQNLRAEWLGRPDGAVDLTRAEANSSGLKETACPDPQSAGLPILRDPTCRRLNTLMTRLATRAHGLVAEPCGLSERRSSLFGPLSLWDCQQMSVAGPPWSDHGLTGAVNSQPPTANDLLAPNEAASLLLSDDIPSLLTGQDDPLVRVEQAVREELAAIEGHLTAGRYELAQSRLHVQQKILASLPGQGALTVLSSRIDALAQRVTQHQAQEKQLAFQRTCAGLISEVEQFCMLTDVGQAETALEGLVGRWQQFRTRLAPSTSDEAAGLLEDLAARSREHLCTLQRAQIEAALAEPRRRLRENWPSERLAAVPESVYEALAQCRLHDPQNWIEDWGALEEQLDAHQGRYYTGRALSVLSTSPVSWDQVKNDLVKALTWDPDQWLVVAPLFGLQGNERGSKKTDGPQFPRDYASLLLKLAFQQVGMQAAKCLRLWRCVEKTLTPALSGTEIEALACAQGLAQQCLEVWPAGLPEVPGRADPRHPVNCFLEACAKAHGLAQAQQLLGARSPQTNQVVHLLTGVLQSGLDTRDQLRRAVTGLYLAQFRQKDPPSVQREVLRELDEWALAVPEEEVPRIRGQDVSDKVERIRESMGQNNL